MGRGSGRLRPRGQMEFQQHSLTGRVALRRYNLADVPRQQFLDAIDGVVGNAREHLTVAVQN